MLRLVKYKILEVQGHKNNYNYVVYEEKSTEAYSSKL
jgi:hypothetical protein